MGESNRSDGDLTLRELFSPNERPIAEIISGGLVTSLGNFLLESSPILGGAIGLGGIALMGHGLFRFDNPKNPNNSGVTPQ